MESLLSLGNGNRLRRVTFWVSSRWDLWGRQRETETFDSETSAISLPFSSLADSVNLLYMQRIHKVIYSCLYKHPAAIHQASYSTVKAHLTTDLVHSNPYMQSIYKGVIISHAFLWFPQWTKESWNILENRGPFTLYQKLPTVGSSQRVNSSNKRQTFTEQMTFPV